MNFQFFRAESNDDADNKLNYYIDNLNNGVTGRGDRIIKIPQHYVINAPMTSDDTPEKPKNVRKLRARNAVRK